MAEDIYDQEADAQHSQSSKQRSKDKFKQSFSSTKEERPKDEEVWKPSARFNLRDYEACMGTLELKAPFKKQDIKKAYRRMAMIYHPDRPKTGDEKAFLFGTQAFEYVDKYYLQYLQHLGA